MKIQLDPPQPTEPARLGRRLACLLYDIFPMLALWFVVVVAALALHYVRLKMMYGDSFAMGHAAIMPGSWESWLLFVALFSITGVYATVSWRRGGQTIGMKPFRVYVVNESGKFATLKQLWIRFIVGLIALPVGFWVALFRPDRKTLHDVVSGTRFIKRD